MEIGLAKRGYWFNDTHLVAKDSLKLNNAKKYFFNKSEHYFLLFLTIKYLWMFYMSDLSAALQSTKKSHRLSLKNTSLDSTVPNLLDMLPRQNWVGKLAFLLLALNL